MINKLIDGGFLFGAGVPCSLFKKEYKQIEDNKKLLYISAVDEKVALGIVNGFTISNKKAFLITQNSAVGKVLDLVMSFNIPYGIRLMWLLSVRGIGDDTVVHQHSALITKRWLKDCKFKVFEWRHFEEAVKLFEHDNLVAILKPRN